MDTQVAFAHYPAQDIKVDNPKGTYHGAQPATDAFQGVYDDRPTFLPGDSAGGTRHQARVLLTVAAIHGYSMPPTHRHHRHMGTAVMLALTGNLARAAVDTTIQVNVKDSVHLVKFSFG